jgi:hypothetical protein
MLNFINKIIKLHNDKKHNNNKYDNTDIKEKENSNLHIYNEDIFKNDCGYLKMY